MFRTMSQFVQSTFNTLTSTVDSLQKVLDIGNDYIANQHKSVTRTVAKAAILNTAHQHVAIQNELEADDKLAKIFADLEAEW